MKIDLSQTKLGIMVKKYCASPEFSSIPPKDTKLLFIVVPLLDKMIVMYIAS